MTNCGFFAALGVIALWALATAIYYRERVLHALSGFWWRFVILVDTYMNDPEDEVCPDWADPVKWEASRL